MEAEKKEVVKVDLQELMKKPPKGFRQLTEEETRSFLMRGHEMHALQSEARALKAERDLLDLKLQNIQAQIFKLRPSLDEDNKKLGITSPDDVRTVGDAIFVREQKKDSSEGEPKKEEEPKGNTEK